MRVFKPVVSVVLQEVPGEISIGFMVAGCPLSCKGCSYKSLKETVLLSLSEYARILNDNQGLATCVLFMGGEWCPSLPEWLKLARSKGYKTCLYTGLELEEVEPQILERLDFIKVGRWQGKSLRDSDTNQRFLRLKGGPYTTGEQSSQ